MLFTCSKVHSGKEWGKWATFKHSFIEAICSKQNHIFTEVLLKHILQVRHVLMVTGEITAIFILQLKKNLQKQIFNFSEVYNSVIALCLYKVKMQAERQLE